MRAIAIPSVAALALVALSLFGCGGPPVGDAPESAGGRSAAELPQNEAQKALAGVRPHGSGKGR